jgi:hypothetical protein
VSDKIPGRIEREMSEIRSRMEPDVTDLRKHTEAQLVAKQVKHTIRQRLHQAAGRSKANLKAKQQEFADYPALPTVSSNILSFVCQHPRLLGSLRRRYA